ncbi:hypothetical protein B0T16DRAFT_403108 [Cercophora newfieldiana]|uniref:3'(2'),5'-bisphosphate nucleotidase n=1 Tax=Cercophora newfieldiana TaxID=92897 RepID=A0AA40CTL4_9PEZI|nr:hypothetical protein B0T16DRAFT_403108 [Cercophora newfieldiana]
MAVQQILPGQPFGEELGVISQVLMVAADISRYVLRIVKNPNSAKSEVDFAVLKDDATSVTIADLAIQAVILSVIRNCFPDQHIIAEESADQLRADPKLLSTVQDIAITCAQRNPWTWGNGAALLRDPRYLMDLLDLAAGRRKQTDVNPASTWVVDPIDGTAAFLRGEQFAINVALLDKNHQQIFGAVACPLLSAERAAEYNRVALTDATIDPESAGSLLYAVRGQGAFLKPLYATTDSAQRLFPFFNFSPASNSRIKPQPRSCTSTTVTSGKNDLHKKIAKEISAVHPHSDLTSWVLRWVSLALKKSTYTVWIYDKPNRYAKIWDHAGAMLLFEEVGGVITDLDGKAIDFSTGRLLNANKGFVAAPSWAHKDVLEAVRKVI